MFNPCTLTNIYQQMKQKKHFSYNHRPFLFFCPTKDFRNSQEPWGGNICKFWCKKKKKKSCSVHRSRHPVGAACFGTVVSTCALLCVDPCMLYYIEDHGKILFIWNLDPAVLVCVVPSEHVSQPLWNKKKKKKKEKRIKKLIYLYLKFPINQCG